MSTKRIPTRLPLSLHRFFWDVDPKKVNPAKNPYYVINRLLDKGDLGAARWVLKNFPKEVIIKSLTSEINISRMTAMFFSRYFNVPREKFLSLRQPRERARPRTDRYWYTHFKTKTAIGSYFLRQ